MNCSLRSRVRRARLGFSAAALVAIGVVAVTSDPLPASGVAGFGDVSASTYYTRAVQWLVDNEITTGVSPTCFAPDEAVTRGQAATMIWRMEDEPSAPPHSFDDVVAPWQQGAVSWMAHHRITTGTSDTTFEPDRPITRAEVAALLHRLAGEPTYGGHPFSDVHRAWQQAPVAWAEANEITTGVSPTSFAPEAIATRGQLATFLHRFNGSPATTLDPSHPTTPRCEAQTAAPPDTSVADSTTTTLGTVPQPGGQVVVAFIGDQGTGSDARAVLELIRDQGASMVLHQGDLDYENDPSGWDQLITDVLGLDFPYFATIGNHDTDAWFGPGGYQEKLAQRLARVPEARCRGDLGVKASCTFLGLFFILSGVGTEGVGHQAFIRDQLADAPTKWRICTWHKNQREMQIGGKGDETGWGVYEECRRGGAIIATAHEHSYERTKTLLDMSDQRLDPSWPSADEVRVAPGATFAFVSGLGGKSVRDQERCLPTTPPYGCGGVWASIYADQQNATDGALFCAFGPDATSDRALCWFSDVDGNIPDVFTVTNQN